MTSRPSETCSLCRARVRVDQVRTHRERVHPRELSDSERRSLKARDEERERRRVLEEERAPRVAKDSPAPPVPEGEDEEAGSSLETLFEYLRPPRDQVAPPPRVDLTLWEKLRAYDELLLQRCGERLHGDEEDDEKARWEAHVHVRWLTQIGPDLTLVEAAARLAEAGLPPYTGSRGRSATNRGEAPSRSRSRCCGRRGSGPSLSSRGP